MNLTNSQMNALRRCRRRNLTPLVSMTVGQIVTHLESINLNQLKALSRAMESCGTTNCHWVSYEIAQKYKFDVLRLIVQRKSKKK